MYTRRTFVKNSAMALAGASLASRSILEMIKDKSITGIQLYSVRDDMQKDPSGTLKQSYAVGSK